MNDDVSVASGASSQTPSSKLLPKVRGVSSMVKGLLGKEDDGKDKKDLLFRGFIGGKMFKTSKGYIGQKLDSLWAKQLFDSFDKDDVEIVDHAMASVLADPSAVVIGGGYGAVYSIGDYGFHSSNQFLKQGQVLADNERSLGDPALLTTVEWKQVDSNLITVAKYGTALIEIAVPGDSFAQLAVRRGAFHVAKKLIEYGVDPLMLNVDGLDVFSLLKDQYKYLTGQLSKLNEEKSEGSKRVVLPSEVREFERRELEIISKLKAQVEFVDVFKVVLTERVKAVEGDKIRVRRLKLTRKPIPPALAWNVTLGDSAQAHIDESDEFKGFILERLKVQADYNARHVNLADLVLKQHEGGSDGVEDHHLEHLAATIHQKRGVHSAKEKLKAKKAASEAAKAADPNAAVDSEDEYEIVDRQVQEGEEVSETSNKLFARVKKHKSSTSGLPAVAGVLSHKTHETGEIHTTLYR